MNELLNNILKVGGIVELSNSFYLNPTVLDEPTATNMDDLVSQLEASYPTYERLAAFQNFAATHTIEDERTTSFDDCDLTDLESDRPVPAFNVDFFSVGDIDVASILLDAPVQSVAGVAVTGATQDVVNPSAYLQFIKIANQNFDGSAISVSSVSGSVDGALVAGTDYEVVQNAMGQYGIQIIDSATVTTLTQTFTITYDYTPAASKLTGYKSQARIKQDHLIKFVSCPQRITKGGALYDRVYTVYGVGMRLTSEYVQQFVDLANNDAVSSSLTFTGAKNSVFLWKEEDVAV